MSTTAEPATEPPPSDATALVRRGLFPFFDGVRSRLADIIQVQFRIQEQMPGGDTTEFFDLLDAASGDDPNSPAATDPAGTTEMPARPSQHAAMVRLAAIAGVIFDLPPVNDETAQGLSVLERIGLLNDFLGAVVAIEADDEPDPPASSLEPPTTVKVPA